MLYLFVYPNSSLLFVRLVNVVKLINLIILESRTMTIITIIDNKYTNT